MPRGLCLLPTLDISPSHWSAPPITCLPCSPGVQLSTGCLFLVTALFRTLTIVFPLMVPKVLRLTLLPGKLSWLKPVVVKIGWDIHFGYFVLKPPLIHCFVRFLISICNGHALEWCALWLHGVNKMCQIHFETAFGILWILVSHTSHQHLLIAYCVMGVGPCSGIKGIDNTHLYCRSHGKQQSCFKQSRRSIQWRKAWENKRVRISRGGFSKALQLKERLQFSAKQNWPRKERPGSTKQGKLDFDFLYCLISFLNAFLCMNDLG